MTTNAAVLPTDREIAEMSAHGWSWLYRIGGGAALLFLTLLPVQIAVFVVNPPPASVLGWFQLLQAKRLIGLVDLDLLLVIDQVLTILVFLALYPALWRVSRSFMLVGLALGVASTVLFVVSNPAFAMLSLSDGYAAAPTEAARAVFLAAAQAIMAQWQGSAFQVSYFIGSVGAIIISAVMLRSEDFGGATAYFGILANGIAFGLYVPRIGVYISVFSVLFLWVWYLLMAIRLLKLAGSGPQLDVAHR